MKKSTKCEESHYFCTRLSIWLELLIIFIGVIPAALLKISITIVFVYCYYVFGVCLWNFSRLCKNHDFTMTSQ